MSLASQLSEPSLFREAAYIDGTWIQAADGRTVSVSDPASGAELGVVPDMDGVICATAIAAAERALPAWRAKTAKERATVLQRWHQLMMEHQKDLSLIMTAEQGKPLAEAMGEIAYAASFCQWFGEEAKRVYGETIDSPIAGRRIIVLKQPVGVTAAITPWNFPSAMITRKAAPALAAGCTMVLKPSELTPFSALALCELAERAGVPPGVLSVIPCSAERTPEVGRALCESTAVRKLSFTGSTAVGKLLAAQCAGTVKRLSLELGGNAPFIVFEDANIDKAVEGAIASKFRNAGQTCVCTNRFYVHASVRDEFLAKLTKAVGALTVAPGLEAGAQQGPLINEAAVHKVEAQISDALEKGATLVCGGERHPRGGTFFTPTVLSGCDASMAVANDETFGPIAAVFSFRSEAEVIAAANDTPYGLAAYFYTESNSRVWRVSEALEYGMVGVNAGVISNEVTPFGGVKESGLGREGSRMGIDEYLEVKYVNIAIE